MPPSPPLIYTFDILEVRDTFKTITIRWQKESKIPTIRGKWKRLDDGRIEAFYTHDELEKLLEVYELTNRKETE